MSLDSFSFVKRSRPSNDDVVDEVVDDAAKNDNDDFEKDEVLEVVAIEKLKIPGGETVKLSDFPKMKRPNSLRTGTYNDYFWEITDRKAAAAMELQEKQRGRKKVSKSEPGSPPSHFCWGCFEVEGRPFEDCLFRTDGANRSNRVKHHKIHTKDRDDWTGFVFKKLEDLRGQSCGRAFAQQTLDENGDVVSTRPPTSREDFLLAVTDWVAGTAQPLNSTENVLYRKMIDVASRIADPADLIVGHSAVRSSVLKVHRARIEEHLSFLRDKMHRAFLVFDGWDGDTKVIGFSLFYVRDVRKEPLQLVSLPLSFAFAKLDDQSNKMSGQKEILKLLDDIFEEQGLPWNILAGSKSDNAMLNTIVTLNQPGIDFYCLGLDKDYDDLDKTALIGCISHVANLVIQYGTGLLKTKLTGPDAPPPGPDIAEVANIFKASVLANEWLGNSKNFQRAQKLAEKENKKLLQPVTPNATRWISQFATVERAIDNFPILSQMDDGKGSKVLTAKSARSLAEFEAILTPMTIFQRVSQTMNKPLCPATLPLISMILRRYGIECTSVLYDDEASIPEDRVKKLKFEVRNPENGLYTVVTYNDLRLETQSLLKSLQDHLIYRFIKARSNKMFYEILGMFIDPIMKEYAARVCGEGSGAWGYHAVQKRVEQVLKRFGTRVQAAPEAEADVASEDVNRNVNKRGVEYDSDDEVPPNRSQHLVSELSQFTDRRHPLILEHEENGLHKFSTLVEIFESAEYDPLRYWSDSTNQALFPSLYRANLVTLAYQASSAYEESLFSTAKITLTDMRNRLYDSPHVAEAVVLLNHALSRQVAAEERKRKAENKRKKLQSD
jgi:hypothetical protein